MTSAWATPIGITADLFVLSQTINKGGSAVRCSEASNRGDARRQPGIPDKTWAKPAKVGEADKIANTKQRVMKAVLALVYASSRI